MLRIRLRSFCLVSLLALGALLPARAEANCGDFGGLAVLLIGGTALGGALVGGLATPAIISLSDETKDYPYMRSALISFGVGGLLSGLYVAVDLGTDCSIADAGGPAFIGVPAATLGASAITALVLWLFADEREPPPFAFGVVPREGGGAVQLGFRF